MEFRQAQWLGPEEQYVSRFLLNRMPTSCIDPTSMSRPTNSRRNKLARPVGKVSRKKMTSSEYYFDCLASAHEGVPK
jgi:hypothetical protein